MAARGRAARPTKRGRIVRRGKDSLSRVFGKGYKSGVPLLYLVRGLLVDDPGRDRPYEVHLSAGFQFEKCISLLGIIYMSIVRWVFLY